MAQLVTIGGQGTLFIGEDKDLEFEVPDRHGNPVDMSGWTIQFVVKTLASAVVISKTASVTGAYDADRETNTQRALVELSRADLSVDDGVHTYSLKRTDTGSHVVLAYGECILERTTQA